MGFQQYKLYYYIVHYQENSAIHGTGFNAASCIAQTNSERKK